MSAFPAIRPRTIDGSPIQTVDARDLHAFLGAGRDFTNWIKGRIAKYGFLSGQDFVIVEDLSSPDLASAKSRPQVRTDYFLTLDMAKEVAMVENNAAGRRVRRYFIDAERRLRDGRPLLDLDPRHTETISVRLRLIAETRRTLGLQAARELWFRLDLPVVPSVLAPPAQGELGFDLRHAPVGGVA